MKTLLAVVLIFSLLAVLAFVVGSSLVRDAERQSDAALLQLAAGSPPPIQFADGNATAREVEILARPLSIEVRPRGHELSDRVEFDNQLMQSMADWLETHETRATDVVEAPPPEVAAWLTQHERSIDALATALANGGAPRWPIDLRGARHDQPVPNLMGHVHLMRVLNAASLDRELRADHAGAWKLQHAAWKLTSGLFDRPEMISRLIGVTGVRMAAAVQRKLEAPVPEWRAEIAGRSFTGEVQEAVRFELSQTSRIAREGNALASFESEPPREPRAGGGVAEALVLPVMRWGVAENSRLAFEQLHALRGKDPCVVARQRVDAAIEANSTFIGRRLGQSFMPSLSTALGRAAIADLTVEGTSKVLAAKSVRSLDPSGAWPPVIPAIESSRCEGERWAYTVDPAGAMSLRFSGKIPNWNIGGSIPMEYVAE